MRHNVVALLFLLAVLAFGAAHFHRAPPAKPDCLTWMFHDGFQGLIWWDMCACIKFEQQGRDVAWWYDNRSRDASGFNWEFDQRHCLHHGLFDNATIAGAATEVLQASADPEAVGTCDSTFYGRFTAIHVRYGSDDRLVVFNSMGSPSDRSLIHLLASSDLMQRLLREGRIEPALKRKSSSEASGLDSLYGSDGTAGADEMAGGWDFRKRDADTLAAIRKAFKD